LATPRMSFIGLLHSCVEPADKPLDDAFGEVRGWVNTKSAKGSPKPRQVVGPPTLGRDGAFDYEVGSVMRVQSESVRAAFSYRQTLCAPI
jgi:hypothetical protein